VTDATSVFPWLDPDVSATRALALETLTLDGAKLDTNVASAIQDIPFIRTITGASRVSLLLIDPYGDLLDSGLFSAAVDVEIPAPNGRILAYRMVGFTYNAPILRVEFEDLEVARLRGHKRPRQASRSDVTRAEFIRMLVREAPGIRFWSPELHKRQPIASSKDITPKATKQDRRDPGFGSGDVKIKRKTATREQLRLLEQALDTAISRNDPERAMIGLVEAMTQESVVQNDRGNTSGAVTVPITGQTLGGHTENVGVLHQDSRYWPASRNVARDVTPFLERLTAALKANSGKSIGWCVDAVQRSYSVNTAGQGKDYDQWEAEARDTVASYTGDAAVSGDDVQESTYRKRYVFRRGEPGGKREDTWTCTGRLADEVQWRRFMDMGVFNLASDDYLRKQAPRQLIKRGDLPPGVLEVRVPKWDIGQDEAEVEIDVMLDVLEPPLGAVWVLQGYGRADDRYLLQEVNGSYLRPKATVTLTSPRPKLPEPAAEIGTRAADPAVRSSLAGGNLDAAYAEAKRISGKRYPYVWGGGHAHVGTPDTGTGRDPGIGFDCSGSTGAVLKAGGFWPKDWGDTVPGSGTFASSWGEPGEGAHLTVWANAGHVYIEFRNMTSENKVEHFGTGDWGKGWGGAGFNPRLHPHGGFSPRHWSSDTHYSRSGAPAPQTRRPDF
jgi:hypothetical protein